MKQMSNLKFRILQVIPFALIALMLWALFGCDMMVGRESMTYDCELIECDMVWGEKIVFYEN